MKRSILGVLLVLAFVAVGIAAAPPLTFTFTDVKANKTATETDSYGVNNAGAIAGDYLDSAGVQHGMILAGKKLTTFENKQCAGGGIAAFGINKAGDVAGWCVNGSGIPIGFTRSAAGKLAAVNFPKGTGTEATGINDKGDVAGLYFDSAGAQHGFVKIGKKYTQLDVKGANSTAGWAVNNKEVVTLEVINSAGLYDSYTYTVSTKKLKKINVPGATQSIVHTNNNVGDIVYTIFDSASAGHGVLFHKKTYTQFDDPKASNSTRGDGLSDKLVIVGRYTPSTGGNLGFKAVAK